MSTSNKRKANDGSDDPNHCKSDHVKVRVVHKVEYEYEYNLTEMKKILMVDSTVMKLILYHLQRIYILLWPAFRARNQAYRYVDACKKMIELEMTKKNYDHWDIIEANDGYFQALVAPPGTTFAAIQSAMQDYIQLTGSNQFWGVKIMLFEKVFDEWKFQYNVSKSATTIVGLDPIPRVDTSGKEESSDEGGSNDEEGSDKGGRNDEESSDESSDKGGSNDEA